MGEPFLNPPQGETGLRAATDLDYTNNPDPGATGFDRALYYLNRFTGASPGVQSAVVTGPARNNLRRFTSPKLFDYLDRSPFEVKAEFGTPEQLRGAAGHMVPLTPVKPTDPVATIRVADDFWNTSVPQHESMHAARHITNINHAQRAGLDLRDAGIASRNAGAGYIPYDERRLYPSPIPDNPDLMEWATARDKAFNRAMEDPYIRDFYKGYVDDAAMKRGAMEPWRYQQEAVNEWQAKNSLMNQGWGTPFDKILQLLSKKYGVSR